MWPKRILRKVNKRLQEDKLFAESELQIFRYFPKMHPMVRRELSPIVLSSTLPARFADFVPSPDAQTGVVELRCERTCYFIDEIAQAPAGGGFASSDLWVSQYDYATDKKL